MVEEGEFKKRIHKQMENSLDELIETGRITIALCDLETIIDEAKKEFPRTTPKLEKEYPDTWESELNSLRLQWFKKWFSSEK